MIWKKSILHPVWYHANHQVFSAPNRERTATLSKWCTFRGCEVGPLILFLRAQLTASSAAWRLEHWQRPLCRDALALDTLEPPPDDSPASDLGAAPQASLSPEADG